MTPCDSHERGWSRIRNNQAAPAPATVTMFGKPFDSYTETEAIAEGYIVDVAASIISYKTLVALPVEGVKSCRISDG